MKRIIAITCCLLMVLTVGAQKKEISQAKTYIKSGKDKELASAEKLMTDLLAKDSVNRQNPKIYDTWYEAVMKQYDVIIIGAGPGGIFSAYELVKNKPGMKIAVFEGGGRYPDKGVHSDRSGRRCGGRWRHAHDGLF